MDENWMILNDEDEKYRWTNSFDEVIWITLKAQMTTLAFNIW